MSQTITLHEINREAFDVLYKELGLVKTLRFLNQFSSGKGDYTQLKAELFTEKTVEDIVQEMRKK